MRFGEIVLDAAEGVILAHSMRTPGGSFKKGRVLSGEDLRRLREMGCERVTGARLEAGDVHEDPAAERLARALAGDGVRVAAPFTGRCNLFADRDGVLLVDAGRVDDVNRVDESLTIATLTPWQVVHARRMLATVKVIPFAVPRERLERAERTAAGPSAAVRVQPFRARPVALVQTRYEGMREGILEKTAQVLRERLARLHGELAWERRCAHRPAEVAAAIAAVLADGARMVLVVGASAIVDRADVIPAAIERAGGTVEHFGMPVDPGNLLLLARHGTVPVLGLPGCARSPKFNGLDSVLLRLMADLPVTSRDIMAMGVGGLLADTAERARPRAERPGASPGLAPRVAALVLAAGCSVRMGAHNKLLAPVAGRALVCCSVEAALAAGVEEVVVVTGHQGAEVRRAVEEGCSAPGLRFVHNAEYASGIAASLRAGLAALADPVEAVLVSLGDMPRVPDTVIRRLLAAFEPAEGRAICVPTYRGKRGNPVLWDRAFFGEMAQVRGDAGARHLIGAHEDLVCEVECAEPGVLFDVDEAADLQRLADSAR